MSFFIIQQHNYALLYLHFQIIHLYHFLLLVQSQVLLMVIFTNELRNGYLFNGSNTEVVADNVLSSFFATIPVLATVLIESGKYFLFVAGPLKFGAEYSALLRMLTIVGQYL